MSDNEKHETSVTSEAHTLVLALEDINSIVNLLEWTSGVASVLAQQELLSSSGSADNVTKYKLYAAQADKVVEYMKTSVKVGEPTDGNLH